MARQLDDDGETEGLNNGDWTTYRRLVLSELRSIRAELRRFDTETVKRIEFLPVRNFVYAATSIVMTAVLVAILAIVLKGQL
jgi:hypothetical protein